MDKNVIEFYNKSLHTLWVHEIVGQLSDGMWENTYPNDHYKFWCNLEPRVGQCNQIFLVNHSRPQKNNYGLTRLIDCVGDRMRAAVVMAEITDNHVAIGAAEYLLTAGSYSKFVDTLKAYNNDFWNKLIDAITPEIAENFFAQIEHYTVKDLRKDLQSISKLMKVVKRW